MDTEEQSPVTALSPLRIPLFRAVWLASLVSNFGGIIQSVGASWLMISIATDLESVALVQSSVTLPFMLLSLVSGALADRIDRRKLMLAAQFAMFVTSVLLAICTWSGIITPWLLLCFTFAISCGTAFNAPAWQASVGELVPRSELPSAVALNSMGYNIARSAGPALGALIVAAASPSAAFALNAVSYIGVIVVLLRWRRPEQVSRSSESLRAAIIEGVRHVAASPTMKTVLVRGFAFGVGASVILALLPLVAKHAVGGGVFVYGSLLGAFGVGAVIGGFSNAWLRTRLSPEKIVSRLSVAMALSMVAIGLSASLWLTLVALFVSGVGWILVLATFNVTIQLSAPRWIVARVVSLYQMTAFGGMALGSWLWGELTASQGLETAFQLAGAVTLASALLGKARPLTDR